MVRGALLHVPGATSHGRAATGGHLQGQTDGHSSNAKTGKQAGAVKAEDGLYQSRDGGVIHVYMCKLAQAGFGAWAYGLVASAWSFGVVVTCLPRG